MVQQLPSSGMTLTNKLRLIAIYIISQEGITEDVRRNLVALAGGSSHPLPSPSFFFPHPTIFPCPPFIIPSLIQLSDLLALHSGRRAILP